MGRKDHYPQLVNSCVILVTSVAKHLLCTNYFSYSASGLLIEKSNVYFFYYSRLNIQVWRLYAQQ